VQVLQVVSVADLGAPHVKCVVPVDSWDLPNHGDRQHWWDLCSDSVCFAGRVYHTQSQNQAMVDLGLLVIAYHVCRDCHHCERVSRTSMGYSEMLAFVSHISFFLFLIGCIIASVHQKNSDSISVHFQILSFVHQLKKTYSQ